jgi:hypothetical protein
MGIFDRFRRPQLADLPAPWAPGPSLHAAIVEARDEDGVLPAGFTLPDEAPPDPTQLRWAPGALDGVLSHHGPPASAEGRVEAIAAAVRQLVDRPTAEGLARLHGAVGDAPLLGQADAVADALREGPSLDPEALHGLAEHLATTATEREMVKLGLLLLGLVAADGDEEILWTLGAHDELTLFALVALLSRPEATDRDVWKLARRARGWGRIQAVERLGGTPDPEIRRWLLREGFRNDVMVEYVAHLCATTGGLHEALAGDVDDALLLAASALLEALSHGGPAEDLAHYAHREVAVARYLDRVAERMAAGVADLEVLSALLALRARLREDRELALDPELRSRVEALAERPPWREAVERALDAEGVHGRPLRLSRELGIDTFDRLRARLERDPIDAAAWLSLMPQVQDEARLEVAVALGETLPLGAIASGPARDLGLGPEMQPHVCLDALLQDLDRHPGVGRRLLATALQSPSVRNRNLALRTLAAWPEAAWPDLRTAVARLAAEDPDEGVADRARRVLDGQPLD